MVNFVILFCFQYFIFYYYYMEFFKKFFEPFQNIYFNQNTQRILSSKLII